MFIHRIKSEDHLEDGAAQLGRCREQINQAKQQITVEIERAGTESWERATSWMELSKPLARHLRGQHGVPQNASNAFFKCIELFNFARPFIQSCGNEIRMFDNACLPGDFVRAAEWWAARHKMTVDWRANSLVGGLDDRFDLLRDHSERWMMRPDTYTMAARTYTTLASDGTRTKIDEPAQTLPMTGDVTDTGACDEIMRRLGTWRADIYTSDLGFAVESYFHEEEEHFAAHSAQCFLGMRVLRRGGVMIVKTFTMSTLKTVALISHLIEVFREFHIVKPATSKPDNSECYWVCIDYLGPHHDNGAKQVFYSRALVQAQQLLARRQAQKIMQNVMAFRQHRRHTDHTAAVKRWCDVHIGADTPQEVPAAAASLPTPPQQ